MCVCVCVMGGGWEWEWEWNGSVLKTRTQPEGWLGINPNKSNGNSSLASRKGTHLLDPSPLEVAGVMSGEYPWEWISSRTPPVQERHAPLRSTPISRDV